MGPTGIARLPNGNSHYATSIHSLGHEMKRQSLRALRRALGRLLVSDDGPTSVEYAVIVVACIGAVQTVSAATRDSFDASADSIAAPLGP